MEYNSINQNKWNRNILNTYWIFVATVTLIEVIVCFLDPMDRIEYIKRYILIPSLFLILSVAVAEFANRYMESIREYIIILSGTVMATVIVYVNSDVSSITLVYFLPTLISLSYLCSKKVFVVMIANIISFFSIYMLDTEFHNRIKPWDLVVIVFSLVISMYLANRVMLRGVHMHNTLILMKEESKDLLIKNTLMDKLIKIDALTELYNHMTFHEYLDRLIECSNDNDLHITLAIIDIDDFKKVNDTYGHSAGDVILKRVANVITESIEADDFAARYGGEEFAVIYTEKTIESAYDLTEKMRMKISEISHEEIENNHVTVSIGMQHYKKTGKEELFNGADTALYTAKRQGKNQTVIS